MYPDYDGLYPFPHPACADLRPTRSIDSPTCGIGYRDRIQHQPYSNLQLVIVGHRLIVVEKFSEENPEEIPRSQATSTASPSTSLWPGTLLSISFLKEQC